MGESIDVWREFFKTTADTDVFEIIHKAIAIAKLDRPKDLLLRRDSIAERLFSRETTRAAGDRVLACKESRGNGNMGNVERDVVNTNYSRGEAEILSGDVKEASHVVGEVVRIEGVLDNANSRTNPASEVASRKFEKRTLLQPQDSNGSVAGCKRPLASRQDKIKGWNDVEVDIKFQATKRKMQELYQKAETDKRQRRIRVVDPRDLPKMAPRLKAPRATTAEARWWRVSSRSRVSCV